MLNLKNTVKFKKDLKKFKHQQIVLKELNNVLNFLKKQMPLDQKYHDHPLTGNWVGHRECHIRPDILLIYKINPDTLFLERLGSHAELFN